MKFAIVTDNGQERCGSFGVLILDGRNSRQVQHIDAVSLCKREKANGYNLYRGDSIFRSSLIEHKEI